MHIFANVPINRRDLFQIRLALQVERVHNLGQFLIQFLFLVGIRVVSWIFDRHGNIVGLPVKFIDRIASKSLETPLQIVTFIGHAGVLVHFFQEDIRPGCEHILPGIIQIEPGLDLF